MDKLRSMKDFVFQEHNKFCELPYKELEKEYDYALTLIAKFRNYAEFLNQPLTLGIFVPCDLDGNVLEEPEDYKDSLLSSDEYSKLGYVHCNEWHVACAEYQEAKSRVFFDVYDIKEHHAPHLIQIWHDKEKYLFSYNISSKLFSTTANTIEDLVKNNLVLTESAKKQIGI